MILEQSILVETYDINLVSLEHARETDRDCKEDESTQKRDIWNLVECGILIHRIREKERDKKKVRWEGYEMCLPLFQLPMIERAVLANHKKNARIDSEKLIWNFSKPDKGTIL